MPCAGMHEPMQYIGIIFAAAVVLAAIQAAFGFLVIAMAGALLLSAIWRPAQSLGVLLLVGYIYLLGQHGWATLLGTAALLLCGYLAKRFGW